MKLLSMLVAAGLVAAATPAFAGDRWAPSHPSSPPQTPGGHSTGFIPPSGGGWTIGGGSGGSGGGGGGHPSAPGGSPTHVPEPASMSILGSGLAALAAVRRRRRLRN